MRIVPDHAVYLIQLYSSFIINPPLPLCIHQFFLQGDLEREAGHPISPMMDRTKMGITKSQPGFFNVVALPLYEAFCKVSSHASSRSAPAALQLVVLSKYSLGIKAVILGHSRLKPAVTLSAVTLCPFKFTDTN